MPHLLILDCDGVIADTEPIAAAVLADMVRELGSTLPDHITAAMHNGSKMSIVLDALAAHLARPLPDSFITDFRARSADRFRAELRPIPGIVETLRALNRPACVASNGPRAKVELILEVCGVAPLIQLGVHSAYDANLWKPDPRFFHWVARRCNTPPDRCIVIDDSILGIQAAAAAGIPAILYDADATLRPQLAPELLNSGTVHVLHDMTELATLVPTISCPPPSGRG